MRNSTISKVEDKGIVVLKMISGKELTLMDVLHVSKIHKNLILGLILNNKGFRLDIESKKVMLTKSDIYVGRVY
ncbi:hypothetical protein, partial [Klebsiella pneumoniae]|uniref:hypothetical protein n=1 Tax=Klebsiella pneumoniae TaxID=573 RepID=UPI003F811D39